MRVANFNLAIIDVVRVANAGRILASMHHEWRAPRRGRPNPRYTEHGGTGTSAHKRPARAQAATSAGLGVQTDTLQTDGPLMAVHALRALSWVHMRVWGAAGSCHTPPAIGRYPEESTIYIGGTRKARDSQPIRYVAAAPSGSPDAHLCP